jgi:unsaturated rhamnogalacturonyl hydrolase
MNSYFDEAGSMHQAQHDNCEAVLQTVANKYMGDHPPVPLNFRLSNVNGIKRNDDCRYVFDLFRIFPDAKNEQIIYAFAKGIMSG